MKKLEIASIIIVAMLVFSGVSYARIQVLKDTNGKQYDVLRYQTVPQLNAEVLVGVQYETINQMQSNINAIGQQYNEAQEIFRQANGIK